MKKNLVPGLLAISLVVFSTWSLKAQEVFSPYEGPDSAGLINEFGDNSALRQRLVQVNLDILQSAYQSVSEGGDAELTLNLFPDESFTAIINSINEDPWGRADRVALKGRSLDGDFTYIPQEREKGYAFLFFDRPEEFTYYLISEVKDGVSVILKLPSGSLFSHYRGGLTPDESQISGKRYRLVHVNHEEIFSKLENFFDGNEGDIFEAPIFFGLFTDDLVLSAYIESAIHTPVENALGDYKITLEVPRGRWATEDNTFDLNIVDGKVTSMEITYNWATGRSRYRVVPFNKAEGVYIMTSEAIEDSKGNE